MATVTQIVEAAKVEMEDVTSDVESRLYEFVHEGIHWLEDEHNFPVNRLLVETTTAEDVRSLLGNSIDSEWGSYSAGYWQTYYIRFLTNPWVVDQNGYTREIEWITDPMDLVRMYDHDDSTQKGEPRHLYREAPDLPIRVYPLPDAPPDGTFYTDNRYRVRFIVSRRMAVLGNTESNWFTDNCTRFLEFYVAAAGFRMMRDEERWAAYTALMDRERRRIVRTDKKSRLDTHIALDPRLGVYSGGGNRNAIRNPWGNGL